MYVQCSVGFDRCSSDINPCDGNAQCMDMERITCTCRVGFSGDGRTCSGMEPTL